MDAWRLRQLIYEHLAADGTAPDDSQLAAWSGGVAEARELVDELQRRHAVVLDEQGRLRMALPFACTPTTHRVVAGERSWWANCAWDALAIPAALSLDAQIEATWMDTGTPVDLQVVGGRLGGAAGFVHFVVPAARWWDDIVET